jgi:cbb3-type cytochrome oxidase maturation protein
VTFGVFKAHRMQVLLVLIGISLCVAGLFLWLFFSAVKKGQFEDTQTPALRMLQEDGVTQSKQSESKNHGAL